MKVLLVAVASRLRHFEDVIAELRQQGHDVEILSTEKDSQVLESGAHGVILKRRDAVGDLAYTFRTANDYLRYLEPTFKNCHTLRQRAYSTLTLRDLKQSYRSQKLGQALADLADSLSAAQRRQLSVVLREVENEIDPDPTVLEYLRGLSPDVVLVTPLIQTYLGQFEFVKAAQSLGIPTACLVFSWDNLTTKGIFHIKPDKVFVWNDLQKAECLEAGFKPSQIVVTGAPRFDAFYRMKPMLNKADYCARYGLDQGQATILYLCSSELIAAHEVDFVKTWVKAIRRSPLKKLSSANIVIRPHPRMKKQWQGVTFKEGRVVISLPQSVNSDQSLYDALFHADVAVGLNTSAQLEAAILGKPVLTIKVPQVASGQDGTIHYRYLLDTHGGFVEEAEGLDGHLRRLGAVLSGQFEPDKIRRFVEYFIRPAGLNQEASKVMAGKIAQLKPSAKQATAPVTSQLGYAWRRWAIGIARKLKRARKVY